jgi:hypothetical protein
MVVGRARGARVVGGTTLVLPVITSVRFGAEVTGM